jgi:hypothetical protein
VVAHVLSNPGREYAIYLDGNGPADLTLALPPGDYKLEWLNTKSGAIDKSEDFHHADGEKSLTSPPFENGVALRLSRTTR